MLTHARILEMNISVCAILQAKIRSLSPTQTTVDVEIYEALATRIALCVRMLGEMEMVRNSSSLSLLFLPSQLVLTDPVSVRPARHLLHNPRHGHLRFVRAAVLIDKRPRRRGGNTALLLPARAYTVFGRFGHWL